MRFDSELGLGVFSRISSLSETRCMAEGTDMKERHPNVAGVGRQGGRVGTDLCYGMLHVSLSQLAAADIHPPAPDFSLYDSTARVSVFLEELLFGEKHDLPCSVQAHATKRFTTVLCRPQEDNMN